MTKREYEFGNNAAGSSVAILWIIALLACSISINNLIRMIIRQHHLERSEFAPLMYPLLTIVFMQPAR